MDKKIIKVGNEKYMVILPEVGEDIKVYGLDCENEINEDYKIVFTDDLKVKEISCEYDQPTVYELVAIKEKLFLII